MIYEWLSLFHCSLWPAAALSRRQSTDALLAECGGTDHKMDIRQSACNCAATKTSPIANWICASNWPISGRLPRLTLREPLIAQCGLRSREPYVAYPQRASQRKIPQPIYTIHILRVYPRQHFTIMTFSVLTESNVRQITRNLSTAQLDKFVHALKQALVHYSCRDGAQYQPARAVVCRPDGQTSLFMPATTQHLIGVKTVGVRPADARTDGPPTSGLKSVLTLCDAQGQAIGVLNAAEITAFRTSLAAMILFQLRSTVKNIVVFGAGKQAFWHIKLAMLMRGSDISKITIVNRSSARTVDMINELNEYDVRASSYLSIAALKYDNNREAALKEAVVEADAIFCTTPSTQPLFPSTWLTSNNAQKSCYISAIGSYRMDMQELDPELLKHVTSSSRVSSHPSYKGGMIAVDGIESCLKEAGELVQAGIPVEKMFEIGNILQAKRSKQADELVPWLEKGFLIYKSVGIGVMDLAIGQHLLSQALSQGIGLHLDDF